MGFGVFIPIAGITMVGFVSWVVIASLRRYAIARMQAGVQAKLLDRFGSADSLIAYGNTEPGRLLLTSLVEERTAQVSPYGKILWGVQAGILLSVFGLVLLLLHRMGIASEDAAVGFGAIALALGSGFILAAAATYSLSKSFGLLEKGTSL